MNPYKGYNSACAVKIGKEIIFSGGYSDDDADYEKENTTIYTNDGQMFVDLPQMPSALTSHCIVALDGKDLFVTGGKNESYPDDSDISLLYHSDIMQWEELPGLPTPRSSLMCGLVHNSNQVWSGQEVIAAGGFDYGRAIFAVRRYLFFNNVIIFVIFLASEDTYSNVVEIYNVQSRVWRTGGSTIILPLFCTLFIKRIRPISFQELLFLHHCHFPQLYH